MRQQEGDMDAQRQQQQQALTSLVGPVEVDWFKMLGYYGGIALAVAAGVIEPPVGIFIGATPIFRMLKHPDAPLPIRALSDTLAGPAIPVGGSADPVVRLKPGPGGPERRIF